jgi:tRNA 5-methylaminomethyl-2-thiouridine biosynthesis bifunctional protein
MDKYDYAIVGAGICGCSIAYELSKYSNSIALIEQNNTVASQASGAAGAFLSPLLGKPNQFKDLVTTSLKYSVDLYEKNFSKYINRCGTTRIPKDKKDQDKFQGYIPYMDFEYDIDGDGYYFDIGTVVDSKSICEQMVNNQDITNLFDFKIEDIVYDGEFWILNSKIKTKNLILSTGSSMQLLDEKYLTIREVWGQRIDISTTTNTAKNYHKRCSVSKSTKIDDKYSKISIGATHHRDKNDIYNEDDNTKELLEKANDIIKLEDVEVLEVYKGARACSVDYIPMVGEIVELKKTLKNFPYLVNGTHVPPERFSRYSNLYIMNGVGGRGFVLAPYLAKILVENIINGIETDEYLTVDRLFKRYVKRMKNV